MTTNTAKHNLNFFDSKLLEDNLNAAFEEMNIGLGHQKRQELVARLMGFESKNHQAAEEIAATKTFKKYIISDRISAASDIDYYGDVGSACITLDQNDLVTIKRVLALKPFLKQTECTFLWDIDAFGSENDAWNSLFQQEGEFTVDDILSAMNNEDNPLYAARCEYSYASIGETFTGFKFLERYGPCELEIATIPTVDLIAFLESDKEVLVHTY